MKLHLLISALAIVLGTALPAPAQEKGTLQGRVIDRTTRQPLAGANVALTGTPLGAATTAEGMFTISGLEESIYKLRTSIVGYRTLFTTDVRVVRGKTSFVTLEMDEEAIDGEEITVTPSAFEVENAVPLSSYTYSREEINRSPGAAGDIFRAIETLPGVSSSGGEFSSFSVRGGGPRDNIILVDNIPFDRVSHFDGGTEEQEAQGGRFSIFAPRVIDQAVYYGGGFGARHGGKHSSLVDMRIKDGNPEDFTANGSFDIIGWEVNYDGPTAILPTTALMLSARHQDFTRILTLTGQADLGQPAFTDFIAKTTTRIDGRNTLSILGILSPETFERTMDNVYESRDLLETSLLTGTEEKYLLGADWRLFAGGGTVLRNTVYGRVRDNEFRSGRAYTDPVNGVVPEKSAAPIRSDIAVESTRETELGWKSSVTTPLGGGFSLTAGVDVQRIAADYALTLTGGDTLYTYDARDARPDPSRRYLVLRPDDVNTRFDDAMTALAGYAEVSIAAGALTLEPGVRTEWDSFNEDVHAAPRFSVSYAADSRTKLSFATGLYFQHPDVTVVSASPANRTLSDERSTHAILGVTRYLGEDLKVSLETYYKDFRDLLVRGDRTTQEYVSTGRGHAYGVDVSFVKRFVDDVYGQITYSWSWSRRNDGDSTPWYNSDFHQPHMFNILVGYQATDEVSLSAKWKYATGRPADRYIVHGNVFSDPSFLRYSREITGNNARRLPDFHTLNLRLDYRKQLGPVALVTFLDLLNVYGHLNVNEERFLERTGEIEEKGFELLPTIGVKLEL